MQSILFKASGRSSKTPIVILTGPTIGIKTETIGSRLSRTLTTVCNRAVCKCTPRRIIQAIISEKACAAVGILLSALIWWHIASTDGIATGRAIATDCLYAMPWGIIYAIRATISAHKEGGEL